METPAPATSAPASAPPAPSAPASSPAPSSSPSTSPAAYGSVPKDKVKAIFDQFDAPAPADEASETDSFLGTEQPAPVEDLAAAPEPTPGEPAATPAEESLPPRIREQLKAIVDPKVRAFVTDAVFMRQELQKTGLPFEAARQFLADAPAYLQKAPTVDVLNQMAATAQATDALGTDYLSASPEGYGRFTKTLLDAGPDSFAGYVSFLFDATPAMIQGLQQHYGADVAAHVQSARDRLVDNSMRRAVARWRQMAKAEGADGISAEVADWVEKDLQLGQDQQAAGQVRRPDPRDIEIQRLRGDREMEVAARQKTFRDGVTGQALNTIGKEIEQLVAQRGSGLTQQAREEITKRISKNLFNELDTNPGVLARVGQINAAGRWDNAHADQLHNEYVSIAKRLLATIAPTHVRYVIGLVGPGAQARQQRIKAQIDRRDPGASGLPAAAQAPSAAPAFKPGMSEKDRMKAIFEAADLRAAQQGG